MLIKKLIKLWKQNLKKNAILTSALETTTQLI
jgi:hypothetical protein